MATVLFPLFIITTTIVSSHIVHNIALCAKTKTNTNPDAERQYDSRLGRRRWPETDGNGLNIVHGGISQRHEMELSSNKYSTRSCIIIRVGSMADNHHLVALRTHRVLNRGALGGP